MAEGKKNLCALDSLLWEYDAIQLWKCKFVWDVFHEVFLIRMCKVLNSAPAFQEYVSRIEPVHSY